jgi:hypothetical protein
MARSLAVQNSTTAPPTLAKAFASQLGRKAQALSVDLAAIVAALEHTLSGCELHAATTKDTTLTLQDEAAVLEQMMEDDFGSGAMEVDPPPSSSSSSSAGLAGSTTAGHAGSTPADDAARAALQMR